VWDISQNFSFCICEKINLIFDVKTRLFIQHGVGNMIKREKSVQHQKAYSLKSIPLPDLGDRLFHCGGSSASEIGSFQISFASV